MGQNYEVGAATFGGPKDSAWFSSSFKTQCIIAGCSLGIAYGYVWYLLKRALTLLSLPNAWCNWKGELSLEKLFAVDQKTLSQELFTSVQTCYHNTRNPHDTVEPLVKFLDACKQELTLLHSYKLCISWINRLHLKRFFKINQEDMFAVNNRIQRLEYLKTLFFSMLSRG